MDDDDDASPRSRSSQASSSSQRESTQKVKGNLLKSFDGQITLTVKTLMILMKTNSERSEKQK
ncbi:hypothetical protein GBA52_015113 [Prunus armeniaca]|nr:hypothetical protein GBA52_015113 [Prunus armeniaca]